MRAIGFKLFLTITFSEAMSKAAAPSFKPDAFPAVTVPSFLKAGRKVQVNATGNNLTINGANSCDGNVVVGGTNTFTLNINANQESFGFVGNGNGTLTINVAPGVTNLSFANSSAAVWGTGTVAFTGFQSKKIRFGTTNDALTVEQLAKITADGAATGKVLVLDADGYLVLDPLSSESFVKESKVAISYPTHVDNMIYFSKPQKNIEIFNVSGNKVFKTSSKNGIDSITASELSAGIYFIVFDGVKAEKFVKK